MDPASEETCRSLLTEYLIHHCFKNTAKAFINETKKLDACSNGILYRKLCHDNGIDKKKRTHPNGDDMDIDQVPVNEDPIEDDLRWSLLDARKQLYDAIVQGNIPQAFDLIYRHFPSLAAQDPNAPPTPEPRVIEHNSSIDPSHLRYILFKLRCQQFIEIIRSSDSVQAIEFAKMYLRPQHKDHQHLRDEVSVLIAYSSPEESNYRHLLNQERRQELAEQVNTVVLALSNLKCETALEKIQKQITLVQKELGSIDVTQSNIDDKDNRDKMSM